MFKLKPENIDREVAKLRELETRLSEIDSASLQERFQSANNAFFEARNDFIEKHGRHPEDDEKVPEIARVRAAFDAVNEEFDEYFAILKQVEKLRKTLDGEVISLNIDIRTVLDRTQKTLKAK